MKLNLEEVSMVIKKSNFDLTLVSELLKMKKLTIRNMKELTAYDETSKYTVMSVLEKAILKIHNSEPLDYSFEELYRNVENMCTYKYNDYLYENITEIIDGLLKSKIHVFYMDDIAFLDTLNWTWVTFCKQTKLIVNIFLYLDRSIVKENQGRLTLWNMSLNLFKINIVLNVKINSKLIDFLLVLIDLERQGEVIDRNLLKSLINMLHELQIYEDKFEPKFLTTTNGMYQNESQKMIKEYNLLQYLYYVSRRLDEETERIMNYLRKSTKSKLLTIVKIQLLQEHTQQILSKEVDELFENAKIIEITLLYDLFGMIPNGHIELCRTFTTYLKNRGAKIVQDPNNEKNMIQDLLDFKDKVDQIVANSFKNNERFCEAVRSSFKYFINQRHNKPAELLAKFVDFKLRSKNVDENIEKVLDKIMVLFRFVQGKDIFEAFYKRDLAKRLLVGKSSSQDAENSMISKLKLECGASFTAKLEGMFKDIRLSQDINSCFKEHLQNNVKPNITTELSISILTSSFWPSYPNYLVTLPEEMIQYQSTFQNFYVLKYSGRKLQWQQSLGYCILKADFASGKKELQVSLFQTIILLLFNNSNMMTYNEIKESSNLEDNELKRTLQSLACGKSKILLKTPKGKEIEETDSFSYNHNFSDRLFRVKINQVQLKETIEEHHATQESVFHDRQFQIDAAIVRIMKQKKALDHNLLVSELYGILDIPLTPCDIKKRIEQLIERDYIERDKDNQNIYKYVA
ncbi:Cullin protein neddylation domain [Popillia japonica]|uniref:Cullin-4 n=1 Tax=Popillia japonica TaxID=7064 RepID=A0AAW1LUU1_POPJA